ncbi:hypothetical protein WJX81_004014 [Elliptochloris bilobata]|uniref:GYF domain-containing protein n=1 Tax=Elliptochloris bilobata TaxID=381761 RepID=A0AAW1QZ57_9CHLO
MPACRAAHIPPLTLPEARSLLTNASAPNSRAYAGRDDGNRAGADDDDEAVLYESDYEGLDAEPSHPAAAAEQLAQGSPSKGPTAHRRNNSSPAAAAAQRGSGGSEPAREHAPISWQATKHAPTDGGAGGENRGDDRARGRGGGGSKEGGAVSKASPAAAEDGSGVRRGAATALFERRKLEREAEARSRGERDSGRTSSRRQDRSPAGESRPPTASSHDKERAVKPAAEPQASERRSGHSSKAGGRAADREEADRAKALARGEPGHANGSGHGRRWGGGRRGQAPLSGYCFRARRSSWYGASPPPLAIAAAAAPLAAAAPPCYERGAHASDKRPRMERAERVVQQVREALPLPPALPPPPPPPAATLHADRVSDAEMRKEWHYCDPSGQTRGPCSIAQFRKWLADMRARPELAREYREFCECMVWRADTPRMPLTRLVT